MTLSASEKEELEQLRRSAAFVITDPLERAFFDVYRLVESMPQSSAWAVFGRALIEMKRELRK